MRRLLAVLLLAIPFSVIAAPVVTLYGEIATFERYINGTWTDAGSAGTAVRLTVRPHSDGLAALSCAPYQNVCNNTLLGIPMGGWMDSRLEFAGTVLAPDADHACGSGYICSPFDPIELNRYPGQYGSFGDQLHQYDTRDGSTRFARTLWEILTADWIPDGPLGIHSIYGLNGSIDGNGSFSYELRTANGELQNGSYRGTFTITSAYVPTPGTLALLAMGGLVFGLRRHARSKVASH